MKKEVIIIIINIKQQKKRLVISLINLIKIKDLVIKNIIVIIEEVEVEEEEIKLIIKIENKNNKIKLMNMLKKHDKINLIYLIIFFYHIFASTNSLSSSFKSTYSASY